MALVPSLVHQLVNYKGIKEADLSSFVMVGSGAAYMPPDLAAEFVKLTPGLVMGDGAILLAP